MAEKIIIDTDPGIDDAMAIFFAFQSPDLDVLGLTTVFGNVPVDMSSRNALVLCETAGVDIPVCKGMSRQWVGPPSTYAHFVHGEDGFGNTHQPAPKGQLDPRSGAQFIVDTVNQHPGEVSLVAIGPLSNLAMALRLDPELDRKVKQVLIMGGAALAPGNISPVAEANIWNDAYAAQIVFGARWPVTMMGLDITDTLRYDQAFLDSLVAANPKLGGFVNQVSQFYMDFYSQGEPRRECRFHDVTPLAYLVAPELFELHEGKIQVSVDPVSIGQTMFCPKGKGLREPWTSGPYSKVALGVDESALTALYQQVYGL